MNSIHLIRAFTALPQLPAMVGALTLICRDAHIKCVVPLTGLFIPNEPPTTTLNRQVALRSGLSPAL